MVLGSRTGNQRGASVQVEYLIQIQEIKPWPPSQSLRSLRSVLLQWENGDRNSGSTRPVNPSLGSGVGDGRIKFNESFKLPVTLSREVSAKGAHEDTFEKNCLEFNLYEPRRDKTVRGQLLGTVIIDLAEYGVLKEKVTISSQMNCKRSFRNAIQPLLFIKIQPLDKHSCSSSSREDLTKDASFSKAGEELVSSLINGKYAEESEIMSFIYDDVSSHSSLILSSSALEDTGGLAAQNEENVTEAVKNSRRGNTVANLSLEQDAAKPEVKILTAAYNRLNGHPSHRSSTDFSFDSNQFVAKITSSASGVDLQASERSGHVRSAGSHVNVEDGKSWGKSRNWQEEAGRTNGRHSSLTEEQQEEDGQEEVSEKDISHSVKDIHSNKFFPDAIRMPVESLYDTPTFSTRGLGVKGNMLTSNKLRHVKSVQSPLESSRSAGSLGDNQFMEVVKEIDISEDVHNSPRSFRGSETKDGNFVQREAINSVSDNKLQQLEHRIEKLEGELREAATVEVSLYSIVAEHGSSANKVHAPARRLFRLYLHACKQKSPAKKVSAARSAVSGLALVAKACGSDIPRLTFWLSNSVFLRTIIIQAIEDSQVPVSTIPCVENTGAGKGHDKRSPTKWKESSPINKGKKFASIAKFDDWENPKTFTNALEKIEAWIFSRIIESVWWQILTPLMQPAPRKASEKDNDSSSKVKPSLGDQQMNYSLDLWRKAFKDAYERLCPVRAGGHECGCLPDLARLIMEQCVSRLDVAMFNAVLRESADETPTDPVSDPISDSRVLPIPSGKSSFGAGAQLKNAIGNWSRWLTDLFHVDDNDPLEDQNELDDDGRQSSFKSFHLLSALSDLMMLPKDMLLDRSIRKEVCPTFGAALIKKILNNFIPDEFCPDSVPKIVFEALDSEGSVADEEMSIENIPANASPIIYLPPPAASLADVVKVKNDSQLRSGSSVLWKSYTSDDELDELDSPLNSIIINSSHGSPMSSWKPKENESRIAVRYQLLREVWKDGDQL
ncbi:EEIG1/EHBP1 N-terminal domain [Macleaya cordata]|uniref:EEIG1/EHBP1 N-terminal domain n=1 Tax=Macleaya cordata TaxID=56857 RepID=A0A200R4D2_MACCD|nr:EEIG1/EHBP1 N-terminal domain [Macleaya cordata]